MTRLEIASVIGSAAGVLTVLSFIPQAIRSWRTKRTQDLSWGTFILLTTQSAGWAVYGILLKQQPIIWTNLCLLTVLGTIVVAKVKHG